METLFNTDKRIRLGVWGLGRGSNFIHSAKLCNIDVVAGCDIHDEIRERFQQMVPDAKCTADEKEFLSYDMDAVLIATYFPDHARHTIMALEAGKHVMCEVTAFMTPADAVKVIEAVEKSGKVYNLLENYPFTKEYMYLQNKWQEGFFGDFVYGEVEYVHECRCLTYGYNIRPISIPVTPGYHVHNWRSSLNAHLYCTHSLGPAMYITGLRPVGVSALEDEINLPGLLHGVQKTVAPSMIKMSNGGLIRNLMGSTTNDYHRSMRMWGTRAGIEKIHDFKIRVGGSGSTGLFLDIDAKWDKLGEAAEKAGHGGGDFWELYYFAREILTGEPAFWNVYAAADVTMAGLMAIRSTKRNGEFIEIPDFRDKAIREKYRNDMGDFQFMDPTAIFPVGHDTAITGEFSAVMTRIYPLLGGGLPLFDSALDGMNIYQDVKGAESKLKIRDAVNKAIQSLPQLAEDCRIARKIMEAYPDSIGGKTIAKIFETHDMDKIFNYEKTIREMQEWQASIC